ncbi:MAG: GGDEF domain-containing protein [Pirellulales bacterium]
MFADIASLGTLITLNVLFACLALVIGFGLGAWMFGAATAKPDEAGGSKERDSELQRAAERAMMASQRIQDLAKNMASDVDAHAVRVDEINSELQAIAEDSPSEEAEAVFATIGRMIDANNDLQKRLIQAEKQIAAQAADLRSYETEARTDSLTSLANRRAFDDEMQRRFAEWQRRRTRFTLIILDIDNFKKFNDSHGHPAGDEVLRRVGTVLEKTARQMDLPCRYGGEEFAVILPSTDRREACVAAERFRKAIETAVVKFEGNSFSVTASIGVSCVAEDDDEANRLLRRADEALYKSKEAGRNCGHWNTGVECLPVNQEPPPAVLQADSAQAAKLIDCVATRLTFVDVLGRRVSESHRFGLPLSVMHVQVDDYSQIRQQYGRSIGHLMLDSVALFTQSALREMDLLARLEDGEFIILMPGSTTAEAGQIAKRLQASAASCMFPLQDTKSQLRVSLGVAELRPNETAELLMTRAKGAVRSEQPELVVNG